MSLGFNISFYKIIAAPYLRILLAFSFLEF